MSLKETNFKHVHCREHQNMNGSRRINPPAKFVAWHCFQRATAAKAKHTVNNRSTEAYSYLHTMNLCK